MKTSWLMALVFLCGSAAAQWQMQESPTKESLRGLSVYDENTVWASGTHGTYVFTRDGGKTWKAGQVPGAEALDFRDVEAFGDTVYLLAIGPGEKSRIYKTVDGGAHWELQFTNHEPKGFFDCMAFWDREHGIAVGDPVSGKFQIITTTDGKTWKLRDGAGMPAAIEGEGAFAASGTCIAVQWKLVWFATGGAAARVFRSADGGKSWKVAKTPIVHGPAAEGIFSVAFRDPWNGIIAGGDYQHPEQGGVNLAKTADGGKSWKPVKLKRQAYFSSIAYMYGDGNYGDTIPSVESEEQPLALVGSKASAISEDDLRSWKYFLPEGFNAVAPAACPDGFWAVGEDGKIARLKLSDKLCIVPERM